jgi:hypothetical protein
MICDDFFNGLTPNGITTISLIFGILSSYFMNVKKKFTIKMNQHPTY